MSGKRKGYTNKPTRMKLYLEQISALRIAQIAMSEEAMIKAVHELIRLNRQFENEDGS